jgi:hypothetical protein
MKKLLLLKTIPAPLLAIAKMQGHFCPVLESIANIEFKAKK